MFDHVATLNKALLIAGTNSLKTAWPLVAILSFCWEIIFPNNYLTF